MRIRTPACASLGLLAVWALAGCNGKPEGPEPPPSQGGRQPPPLAEEQPLTEALLALLPSQGPYEEWSVQEREGWTAVGRALYDRIDGAAEAYMQYDFKAAARRTYIRDGDVNTYIEATLYEFGSAAEAFGAYGVISGRRGDAFTDMGNAAVYDEGTLFMWQDAYLAQIVASDASKEMYLPQKRMGWAIEKNIERKALGLPAIFDLLPEENRLADTERYAHTAFSVGKIQPGFVAKPLGLSRATEVAVAEYGQADGTPPAERNRVFVIRYPTAEAAARAFQVYNDDPAAGESRVGKTTVMRREGALIVGSWRKSIEARAPVIPAILQRANVAD